ncbi:ComEC/Rec2 family competence protein [Flavobacterium sp. RHBU_24]|uniref:ComEC/Rec2 family competence protein n=1 Tax=Flavobacterium sp. RHBU_24 TaxID=3391185 RepID=UPI0039851DB9
MKVLKYPIIPFTIFMAAGIFTGFHLLWLHYIIPYLLIVSAIFLALTYYYARKALVQKPNFAAGVAIFAFVCGIAAQCMHYAPNDSRHYANFLNSRNDLSELPTIRGVITERIKPNDFSEKYYLEITSINLSTCTGTLLVTMPKNSLAKTLHAGDVLYITALPKPITPALNPNQFDYAGYMARQNIFGQIKLKNNYIIAGQQKGFNYHINRLRETLTGSFSIHHYPLPVQNLINALMFGQRQDMEKEMNSDYINAGVIHVLAISGLHFTLLFAIFNGLLAPLKRFRKFGTTGHFISILLLMWLFALITGLSASVVRAVVMFSFLMTGGILARRVTTLNSLAISALVLLLAKPSFLFDAGFQLSYIAVLGIVLLQPFYKKWKRSKYTLIAKTQDLIAVSLAAQLFVLPISLYYFNQFPLLFLVANIVVIPLSDVVLILGLVTLALNFTIPVASIWIGKLLEYCILFMNSFVKWVASFDSLVLKNIPFTLLMNLCLYGVIGFGVWYLYKKSYRLAVAALVSVLVFQLAYMVTAYNLKQKSELVVFNNYGHTLIAQKTGDSITVSSTDSLALQNYSVLAYAKGNFNYGMRLMPLQNYIYGKGKKIYILDKSGMYDANVKPDILLLSQSPKVNLERALADLKPKIVIADATNYKTYSTRWRETCARQKIPFHATAENGSYILE